MNDKKLLKFATSFTKGMLSKRSNESMCYIVSAPLSTMLEMCGEPNELLEVQILNQDGIHHHWIIRLHDKRVVDATASQFKKPDGSDMPEIYVGALPEWYKEIGKLVT